MAQIPHLFKLPESGDSRQKAAAVDGKDNQCFVSAFQRYSKDKHCLCPQNFLLLTQFLKIKHLDTGTYRCQEQCDHIYSQRCLSESPFLLLLQLLPSQLLSFLLLPQSLQLLPLFFLRGIEMSLYPVASTLSQLSCFGQGPRDESTELQAGMDASHMGWRKPWSRAQAACDLVMNGQMQEKH